MTRVLDDLNVMVAGQGGDGSQMLTRLLAELLGGHGFDLYESRDVLSRVKGGHAAARLRASRAPRGCLGDGYDLLVAFDAEAVEKGGPHLREGAYVVYDASDHSIDPTALPADANLLELPFGRFAVRDLRRDLFKNSLAFGLASRLFGVGDAETEAVLRRRLARLPGPVVEANVLALRDGLGHADALGLAAGTSPWSVGDGAADGRLLLTGNVAVALGFLAAGGRFFAGYPITPASEILEWLSAELPRFGGVAIQAEDELAAINLALGAAQTGVRTMTASSGPGIALMQEGIGHAGSAEIGLVVVDCQRAGPSTGMPTKPEQSDLAMLVHGANGDTPRIVLAPGNPAQAFELAVLATNLAERLQGPVVLALDQAVAQDSVTVDRLDPGGVRIDRGKRLDARALAGLEEYRRYSLADPDGISPWSPVGTPGGNSLVTGNERDEWGRVTTDPALRRRMVEKRARKLETVRGDLPRGVHCGDAEADVALVGFGLNAALVAEAAELLADAGLPVRTFQPLTLWPVLDDVLDLAAACRRIFVVEQNAGGQYASLLADAGVSRERLASVLRYDGVTFRPAELAGEILRREGAR